MRHVLKVVNTLNPEPQTVNPRSKRELYFAGALSALRIPNRGRQGRSFSYIMGVYMGT